MYLRNLSAEWIKRMSACSEIECKSVEESVEELVAWLTQEGFSQKICDLFEGTYA